VITTLISINMSRASKFVKLKFRPNYYPSLCLFYWIL